MAWCIFFPWTIIYMYAKMMIFVYQMWKEQRHSKAEHICLQILQVLKDLLGVWWKLLNYVIIKIIS